MARNAYFYYERSGLGKWSPVIEYDYPPRKSVNGGGKPRSNVIPMSTDNEAYFDIDESPNFSALMRDYPYGGTTNA